MRSSKGKAALQSTGAAVGVGLAIVAILGISAFAQMTQVPAPPEKTYTFSGLSGAEVSMIGKGLERLPFGDVAGLMGKLQVQLTEQQKPAAPQIEAKPEAKPDVK